MKTYALFFLTALVCGAALSCSEPENIVSSSTENGQFRLTIEADKNWVRPRGDLPIRVRLERLGGPPRESFFGEIELIANGGSVSPALIDVALNAPDSTGAGGESAIESWAVFSASSSGSVADRADISAFFGDALATLKIRVVPAAE